MPNDELIALRDRITDVDTQLLNLLSKRQSLTTQVAELKYDLNKPVRDKQREQVLLEKLVTQGQHLNLDPSYITRLFHIIIEHSVLQQQSLLEQTANPENVVDKASVAILGEKGSYSYLAGKKYFDRRLIECVEIGCSSFAQAVKTVEEKKADYAVIPIDNSTFGSINEVYDQLQQTQLHIVGEVNEEIEHHVLVHKDTNNNSIKTLYAHPQIFAQCSHLLAELGNIEVKPCDSTSAAMKKVQRLEDSSVAAIGPELGGEYYGLKPASSNLTQLSKNRSRFIVVASEQIIVPLQVPAKTTVIMSIMQTPGSLVDVLLVLKHHHIAMTKLESRPVPGNPWEEMFYVDMLGNTQDNDMASAIEELKTMTRYFKLLGCYPIESISPTKVSATALLEDE